MVREEDIKQIVEQFKIENGNKSIPLDDMMIYTMHRVDSLPCREHMETISNVKGKIDILIPVMLSLFGLIIGLIYFLHS